MHTNEGLRNLDPADVLGAGVQVLKRLAAPGSKLERREKFYALTGTGRAGRAMHVPLAIVNALQRRDWLKPVNGEEALRLSDVGLGWLKRALAGENPFQEQHAMLTRTETPSDAGNLQPATLDDAESPLTRLRATMSAHGKPLIGDMQFLAGERLRRDFTLANLMPRLTADLEAPVVAGRRGAGHGEFSDITIAARQRFSRAMEALGPDLSGTAVDVCCHLKDPGVDTAAFVVLKLALDRLAHHYGLFVRTRTRTRAWQAPDETQDAENKKAARDP